MMMTCCRSLLVHEATFYFASVLNRKCIFSSMRISSVKKVFDGRRNRNILYAASSGLAVRANISFLGFPLNDPSLLPLTSESSSPVENFSVHNPAALSQLHSSSVIAKIPIVLPSGDEKNNYDFINDAIQRSHRAQLAWRETTTLHRGSVLRAWFELIKQSTEDLATIMTKESGKTLAEAKSEVSYGASFVEYFSAVAISSTNNSGGGVIIPSPFVKGDGISPRGMALSVKEPVGVTAMITPWNFPLAMITRKVAPALAAGCTALVKPSELTPLTAIALQTLALKAGIPEGVFQLVLSHDRDSAAYVGETFCTHELIKKISFTGSTTVGKLLLKQSSSTVKRMSMELGGNAPFIVLEDADIDVAVKAAMSSKFRCAGQTCVCADRFLVHSSIEEQFVSKLVDAIDHSITVGDGTSAATTMGPLITSDAVVSVDEKVKEAVRNGAECVIGGSPMKNLGSNFFHPTVVVNVKPGRDTLWDKETFGPVAAVATFHSDEEAVSIANNSPSGLASYVCSRDVARALRIASRLETGMVGINEGVISSAVTPFGGVKESGLGREGSFVGIEEYLETKYIYLSY